MPALDNPRHERFAQELAKGKTADEAYQTAGLMPIQFGKHAGQYVYLLIDPRSGRPFYVGKGCGKRAMAHMGEARRGKQSLKAETIRAIEVAGSKVQIDIIADGLTAAQATRLERGLIARLGPMLSNIVMGSRDAMTMVAEEARQGIAQIKPLCVLLRERPSRDHIAIWSRVVGELSAIVQKAA